MMKKGRLILLTALLLCPLLAGCSKEEENISGDILMAQGNDCAHEMTVQWYAEEAGCLTSGYRVLTCSLCGYVDEEGSGEVEALGHQQRAETLQEGNCREDTIIVYTCDRCGEQTGYDRYPEPDRHLFVVKETEGWNEETRSFERRRVECCERCNLLREADT